MFSPPGAGASRSRICWYWLRGYTDYPGETVHVSGCGTDQIWIILNLFSCIWARHLMMMFFPSWICAFGQHCFLSVDRLQRGGFFSEVSQRSRHCECCRTLHAHTGKASQFVSIILYSFWLSQHFIVAQGELLLDCCCRCGTDYCDVSGEIPWSHSCKRGW